MLEILKAIVYGVVEGITEWLPISSTGHLILVEQLIPFKNVSEGFFDMFDVVIQLGAILAVVILFWKKIWPFAFTKKEREACGIKSVVKMDILTMWFKVVVACVPAVIIGGLFDDVFNALFYNPTCIAIALIVFGVAFIVVERVKKDKAFRVNSIAEISYTTALLIGCFQVLAAVFPGTSRSGATIIGALIIGVSRTVAAEFTFILAIPVMFGASLLKVLKFGFDISSSELALLAVGTIVSFVVSIFVLRFLLGYIRKHDFQVFGWYRIVLGIVVLVAFNIFAL